MQAENLTRLFLLWQSDVGLHRLPSPICLITLDDYGSTHYIGILKPALYFIGYSSGPGICIHTLWSTIQLTMLAWFYMCGKVTRSLDW